MIFSQTLPGETKIVLIALQDISLQNLHLGTKTDVMIIVIIPLLEQLVDLFILVIRIGQLRRNGQQLPGKRPVRQIVGNNLLFDSDSRENPLSFSHRP